MPPTLCAHGLLLLLLLLLATEAFPPSHRCFSAQGLLLLAPAVDVSQHWEAAAQPAGVDAWGHDLLQLPSAYVQVRVRAGRGCLRASGGRARGCCRSGRASDCASAAGGTSGQAVWAARGLSLATGARAPRFVVCLCHAGRRHPSAAVAV